MSASTREVFVETGYWMASGGTEDFDRFVGEVADRDDRTLVHVSAGGGLLAVTTATEWADVHLTARVHDTEPALDTAPWDAVDEVSILVDPPTEDDERDSSLGIMAGPVPEDAPEPLPVPCPTGEPAWWRLRLHARVGDTGTEEHLLLLWPADRRPTVHHRTGGQDR
ncbi:hypothetical protein M1P56_18530 [Streptomyces sp. HU2014]|uniref:hypothetical protein n=1 Tax=Streptomyces sp. HU2014 TaxID=2939414 RepID=UPI00200D8EC7|nr:hypothetical protein [Streptomyces sp. HU2014]UQI46192.1 hypothetical protein M1P56_18530 [Streptomyces sp. HU2014]